MKRLYQILLLASLFAFMGTTQIHAKKKCVGKMYICGVSYSFTDTVVYITSVQEIDSAWVDAKTDFLSDRNYYSYQLKDYFIKKGEDKRICTVFFAQKRKDLNKKYVKMMKRFSKKGNVEIKQIPDAEFRFKTEMPDPESLIEQPELTKAERKALKAAAKKKKKQSSEKSKE